MYVCVPIALLPRNTDEDRVTVLRIP